MPSERPEVEAGPAVADAAPGASTLRLRILSGLVIAVVALGLLWAGQVPFALFVLAAALAVTWEWSRMVRAGSGLDAGFAAASLAVAAGVALSISGVPLLAIAAIAIGSILTGLLCYSQRPLLSAIGVAYAGLPAVALLWLREDAANGLMAVLFVLLTVAACDIGAYAAGRTIGGAKLAPAISPNKTWSGLAGGILASGLMGLAVAKSMGLSWQHLAALGAGLGLVSQIGDLVESAMKRYFGVKDSSQLIPGHGGVMDRVDGLTFAAIVAALIGFFGNPQSPATALLYGN